MNGAEQQEKFRRITEENITPLLWKMAVPSIIGMAVSSVYSAADTYFVSKTNRTDLTAAVGIVFSFISVIQAIGFWIGYGSGNYISRQIGKKNSAEADRMTSVGFVSAAAAGAVIAVSGLIFIKPLAVLLGADVSDELMTAAISYLRITLITVPFMLASNVLYNILRLQGSSKDSMIGMLAGMILNTLLDPVFILILDMDVSGAALASLAGQISGFLLLFFSMGKRGNTSVIITESKPYIHDIKEILSGGAPNFCRQGISSVSGIILNNIAGGFGEACIAGMTVSTRMIYMGYAVVIGFCQGFQPICAVNYGAGKYERIKAAFGHAMLISSLLLISSAVFFWFGADDLVSVFSSEREVCVIASDMLRAQCTVLPFMAYYILIGMLLQNIGKFGAATLITTAENGIFLIPSAIILPSFFGFGGLLWCRPAAGICALIFSFIIGSKYYKKYIDRKAIKNILTERR